MFRMSLLSVLFLLLNIPFTLMAEESVVVISAENTVPTEDLNDIQMQDARSRFLIWAGQPRQGLKRLDDALEADPDNLDLQIVKVDLDYRLGRWVSAYERVLRLSRRAPTNPYVMRLYHLVSIHMKSSVSFSGDLNKSSGLNSSVSGSYSHTQIEHVLNMYQRLGLIMDTAHVKSPTLMNAFNGAVQTYDTTNRNGIFYYRYLDISGDEAGIELPFQQKHLAIKGDYKNWRPWGFHQFSVMTNIPYWKSVNAIANEYRRDGLTYESDYYIGYDIQSHWGLGLYRYHSKKIGNIAKGTWYRLGLDYKIPERFTKKYLKQYSLLVHYEAKGEAFTELTQRENNGVSYRPFNMKNREVHKLTGEIPLSNEEERYLVQPFAGIAHDTHGSTGIVCGVKATYHYKLNYDIGLGINRDFIEDNDFIGNKVMLTATARFL